jgi:hypothetical protein
VGFEIDSPAAHQRGQVEGLFQSVDCVVWYAWH